MYVLLYVNADGHPDYIQGASVEEINAQVALDSKHGYLEDMFDERGKDWQLLGIEDNRLTPLANVEMYTVPQFNVY